LRRSIPGENRYEKSATVFSLQTGPGTSKTAMNMMPVLAPAGFEMLFNEIAGENNLPHQIRTRRRQNSGKLQRTA